MMIFLGLLQSLGAIFAIWGMLWRAWDHRAFGSFVMMLTALVMILVGSMGEYFVEP